MRLVSKRATVALAMVTVVGSIAAVKAQVKNELPEHFTAFAVNISNVARPGASPVDLQISRWTPTAERDRLMSIFKEKGQDGLLTALQKEPSVGYINTPGTLRYDLRFAWQMPLPDGGRRIILATDRPIGFWEARSGSRTLSYPFTLIQIELDKGDQGVGKLSIATKITLGKDGVIELENFANLPVQLNQVRKSS